MTDEAAKQVTNSASIKIIIAVIAVVVLSIGTGIVVHHNDANNTSHAMMVSEVMQKKEVKMAASAAAMKQAEADKMAAHDAMANTTSGSTSQ